jgi:acylphosphatase
MIRRSALDSYSSTGEAAGGPAERGPPSTRLPLGGEPGFALGRAIISAPLPMRLGRHYLVTGRVQGVGFRYFTWTEAVREGLHGWVRNVAEGAVEISAEGDRDALDRFERAVRRGPASARIEQIEVTDIGAGGRDTGFEVRE